MFKRKNIFMLIFVLILLSIITILFVNYNDKKRQEKREKRYDEIRESIKKAMDWEINATFVVKNEDNCKGDHKSFFSSDYLINYGYLKQREMLDVDEESYCKAYIYKYMGENCTMKYDIYLSCKDYEDEGYINWGD